MFPQNPQLPQNPNLQYRARKLRTNATIQENHLWYDFLSPHPFIFQRQKNIANYIVDFYCHQAKLIIEIDGSQHFTDEGIGNDKIRTDILESLGLRVIRFTNNDIDNNFNGVCYSINEMLNERVRLLLGQ